jgi:hypothetical protein
VPADQAQGLRRRSHQQPLQAIHCFFDAAESTVRLAQALHRRGWTSLLVDTRGRLFADSPARSLFDWRQQIARGLLHTLAMSYGNGWHAPGLRGDEPALTSVAHEYDCLLIDAGPGAPEWTPLPAAARNIVIEANATQASMLQSYALLKGLSSPPRCTSVGLLGDAAACARLQAACAQFLDPAFCQAVYSVAGEVDAFAALAVRMTSEEKGRSARYKTGST